MKKFVAILVVMVLCFTTISVQVTAKDNSPVTSLSVLSGHKSITLSGPVTIKGVTNNIGNYPTVTVTGTGNPDCQYYVYLLDASGKKFEMGYLYANGASITKKLKTFIGNYNGYDTIYLYVMPWNGPSGSDNTKFVFDFTW